MDIIKLYTDFNVPYLTEGHAHCMDGWVSTPCPLCSGNPGYHLGYNLQNDYFVCWRCGWHPVDKVLEALIHVSRSEANNLIVRYRGRTKSRKKRILKAQTASRSSLKYPSLIGELRTGHLNYLKKRGFNTKQIEADYGIQGTGPISLLGKMSLPWRLIIPIIFNGKAVSWQSRAIRDYALNNPKQKLKYITCPKEYEVMHHKHILYGYDQAKAFDYCIVCEGVFDVWRLGAPAVCTFGTKYKMQQLKLLKGFKTVFIAYDPDPAGRINAKKMQAQLRWAGVKAFIMDMECDPGEMTNKEAKRFINQIKEMM